MRHESAVLILASGTRGDVEPLTALAQAMAARGIRSVIAAHRPYQRLVLDAGLPFEPLEVNPSTLLARLEMELPAAASPLAALRAWRRYLRESRVSYRAMAERTAALAAGAGALILGLPSFWLYPVARHLRIPTVCGALQPLTPTCEFPCAWLGAPTGGRIANRASHSVGMQLIWQPWRRTLSAWARDTLPGTPIGFLGPLRSMIRGNVPFVYGISPLLVERPRDWPAHHVMTGFWIRSCSDAPVPERLLRFMEAPGPPVIFVTMGCVDYRAGPALARVRSALAGLGLRAVIQTGHLPVESSDHRIHVTSGSLPHDWLLSRVAAVIHHGGAGTCARAIAAGIPSLALTGIGDGAWWGERCRAAGISPPPLPVGHAEGRPLAASILRLVESRTLREHARALGAAVRNEDGPGTAARIIADALGSRQDND